MGSKGYTGDLEGCRMPRPTAIIRDPNQEQQVQEWIKAILGEWPEDLGYAEALKDGVILCRLMNVLSPGSVARINTKGAGFKLMENIVAFQSAMAQYGVDKVDIRWTSSKPVTCLKGRIWVRSLILSSHWIERLANTLSGQDPNSTSRLPVIYTVSALIKTTFNPTGVSSV